MDLTLASTSAIRRSMLVQAGVAFDRATPGVDESAAKSNHADPTALVEVLARAKALAVSATRPDGWVIGSDSTVSVDGCVYDKPAGREQAAQHLREFSGKEMVLTSAVALARSGSVEWSHTDSAILHVRPLSEHFISDYLEVEWPEVGYCAGVFRLEGRGVQLFDRIDGNYFTILGMPLLPLLKALRQRGLIPA